MSYENLPEPRIEPPDDGFETWTDSLSANELADYWHQYVGNSPNNIKEEEFWAWLHEKYADRPEPEPEDIDRERD